MVLLASGPLRLRDLAEQIGTDPTTLSRNVDVLQRRGLLKSLRSEDGRERVITNTVSAGLLLSKAVPLWEKTQSLVEHAFGKQNIARLHKDLRGVTEAMLRGSD